MKEGNYIRESLYPQKHSVRNHEKLRRTCRSARSQNVQEQRCTATIISRSGSTSHDDGPRIRPIPSEKKVSTLRPGIVTQRDINPLTPNYTLLDGKLSNTTTAPALTHVSREGLKTLDLTKTIPPITAVDKENSNPNMTGLSNAQGLDQFIEAR